MGRVAGIVDQRVLDAAHVRPRQRRGDRVATGEGDGDRAARQALGVVDHRRNSDREKPGPWTALTLVIDAVWCRECRRRRPGSRRSCRRRNCLRHRLAASPEPRLWSSSRPRSCRRERRSGRTGTDWRKSCRHPPHQRSPAAMLASLGVIGVAPARRRHGIDDRDLLGERGLARCEFNGAAERGVDGCATRRRSSR